MKLQEEIELTDPKLNPALKYGKSLAEKRFMLNLFIKYNIEWRDTTFWQLLSNYLTSFWSAKSNILELDEKNIDLKLSQLEPQIPTEPCIMSEIILDDFTSPENISSADERIFNMVRNISATDTHQLIQYADNGNPVAQLFLSFIHASKYDVSAASLRTITDEAWIITNESSNAKKYLEQSATQYDLAKFFLCRNKIFGNQRWNTTKDIKLAITDIESLSKPKSIYTILCTSLLYNAYIKGIIVKSDLSLRLNVLLNLIIDDKKRRQLDLESMRCRGAQPSPESKLSHDILNRNSQFESEEETHQTENDLIPIRNKSLSK